MTPPFVVAFIGTAGASIVDVSDDIDDANRKARERAAKYPGTKYVVYALKHLHFAPPPSN